MINSPTNRLNGPLKSPSGGNGNLVPQAPAIVPTDAELLRMFARQASSMERLYDTDPFAQLMDRHSAMVWRVCNQVLHRRQDAEDAFQVTFLFLARRARSIRASESVAGWLYRVAHRTALSAKRKHRRRQEIPLADEPLAPAEAAFPNLARREMAAVLMEELRRLPAKYQTPLVLRYLEGQSRRAIAEQTDSTIAIVQGQLARGKKLLRGRLLRRGVSLSAAMAIVGGTTQHTEAAPAQLIAQTTSNAVAIATGGSVTASVAVVALYREGVRGMLFAQATKPLAAIAIATLLVAGITLEGSQAQSKTNDTPQVQLLAQAPAEPVDQLAQAPIQVETSQQNKPAAETDEGAIYPEIHDAVDLQQVFPSLTLEALAEILKQSIAPNSWYGNNQVSEADIRPDRDGHSLMVVATEVKQTQIAEALKLLRKVASRQANPSAASTNGGTIAQVGSQITVRGSGPAETYGMQSDGTYVATGRVNEKGMLVVRLPGRPYARLGGFLDETHTAEVPAVGKNPQQVQQAIANWLVEQEVIGLKFNESDFTKPKRLGAIEVTTVSIDPPEKQQQGGEDNANSDITFNPKDRIAINILMPSGERRQLSLEVKPDRTLDLAEYGRGEYGKVNLTDLSLKQAVKTIAQRIRAAHKEPQIKVGLQSNRAAVWDDPSEPHNVTAHRIAPGDFIEIKALGVDSNNPLRGKFSVEPAGTVPLGPSYGRVRIAGLSLVEAESAITEHLSTHWQDPVVQLTDATPAASLNRPTPQNGTVTENWPSGQTKSERIYNGGKVVSAIEYSEDGKVLYEMVEAQYKLQQTAAQANDRPALKKPKPQQLRVTLEEQLRRLSAQHSELLQFRHPSVDAPTDLEQRISQKQHNIKSRIEQIVNVEAEQMIQETELLLAEYPLEAEPEAVESTVATSNAGQTDSNAPPKDNPFEAVEDLLDKAEAAAEQAAQLAEKVRTYRGLEKDPFVDGSETDGDSVADTLEMIVDKKRGKANTFAKRAKAALQEQIESALNKAVDQPMYSVAEVFDSMQTDAQPFSTRLQKVQAKTLQAGRRMRVQAVVFQPDKHITGSEWTVYDEPSKINPNGWAVRAKMAMGGTAPIPLPGDTRPRPKVQLIGSHSKGVTLTTSSAPDATEKKEPQEFAIYRNKPYETTIEGQSVIFTLRIEQVYGDQPRTSPYVWIDICQQKPVKEK